MSQIITVSYGKVRGKAKQYRYWQPVIYEEHKTRDGRIIYKYVSHVGIARRSYNLAKIDAQSYNIPYLEGVRHGSLVSAHVKGI